MIPRQVPRSMDAETVPGEPCLLPAEVRADLEAWTASPVVEIVRPRGSEHPGLAACLRLATGIRLFAKGITLDHALLPRYQAEAAISRVLAPAHLPVPRLRRAWCSSGWWLMVFDGVNGGRHPDLTPGSPDIVRALSLLDRLQATAVLPPATDVPDFAQVVGGEFDGWRQLARTGAALDPWTARNLDRLAATERFWLPYADGTALLHADLGPDTLLLAATESEDVVIDWAYLHRGAAWIDPALFLPHLIKAGHTPQQAEALLDTWVTAWAGAPSEAITFFAIALTGYWERCSRLPALPEAPQLRFYQARMAAIGRVWIRHRTGWT